MILSDAQRREASRHAMTLQRIAINETIDQAALAEAINYLNEIYWAEQQR